ncbi:MAG: hypothetical protein ABFS03_11000, partial [Chloroflexota bacterium]
LLNLPTIGTLTHWLEHTYESFHMHLHHGEFNMTVALSSTVLALTAIVISWLIYGRKPLAEGQADPLEGALGPVFKGMNAKWWVDELYWAVILNPYINLSRFLAETIDWNFWHDWVHDSVIVRAFKNLTHFLAETFDLGWVDGFFNGLAYRTQDAANSLRRIQTGFVRNYALSVFIGVVVILGYLIIQ